METFENSSSEEERDETIFKMEMSSFLLSFRTYDTLMIIISFCFVDGLIEAQAKILLIAKVCK